MLKTTYGLAELTVSRNIGEQKVSEQIQASNVAVRACVRDHLIGFWKTPTTPSFNLISWPWRLPSQWDGGITGALVRAMSNSGGGSPTSYQAAPYPAGLASADTSTISVNLEDRARFRNYNQTAGAVYASQTPRSMGALLLYGDRMQNYLTGYSGENTPNILIAADLPYSSIGSPYIHPAHGFSSAITAGNGFISTGMDHYIARLGGVVRIDTASDKGMYFWHHSDRASNTDYLTNMDGTPFVAQGTGAIGGTYGIRLANQNEVGVPPVGTGVVAFDGYYDPGENRTSYLMRLRFEKSGSPSPSDSNQKGSYWFTIRPWLYGAGTLSGAHTASDYDTASSGFMNLTSPTAYGYWNHISIANSTTTHAMGMGLDRINQRLWFILWDATAGNSIGWWRYKSPECFHEVLSSAGTATDTIAGLSMGGSTPRCVDIGSDGTAYFAMNGGSNPGFIAIKPDLTGSQYTMATLGLSSTNAYAVAVDKSRYRSGTAGDVTVTAATGDVATASGAFTQSDVGRVIKLTGLGVDNGSFKITVVTDSTHVTVQTLAGGAVSFTGGSGGSYQIGDRIYLFFSDAVNNVNKLHYFESLAFGVLFYKSVTMTNGSYLSYGNTYSMSSTPVGVDQSTGVLWWGSIDTTPQVNRYDPATNGWSRRLLTDFNGTNGGSGTIVNPTAITCLGVNQHASFREVWVGTDAGWIKLNQDNFAGAFTRYYGNESNTYAGADGKRKLDGSWADKCNSRYMTHVGFGVDGRVFGACRLTSGSTQYQEPVVYNREADCWTTNMYETWCRDQGGGAYCSAWLFTPYGEIWFMHPANKSSAGLFMYTSQIHYQYIGGQWVPKEAVRGPVPDNSAQPGLQCKDMHTASESLIMGVRCRFTAQGGATPANNEFLGRLGKYGAARTDGAWSNPSASSAVTQVFLGSGFIAGNVGDYLWVKSSTGNGASVGFYQIMTFTNGNTVTVRKMSGTAYTPGSDSGTLTYELWTMGSASNECCSVILGHGVARDSSQDVTNINFDFFAAKTVLSDQQESIKFCVEPPGPPKCPGLKVYVEGYAATAYTYNANFPQIAGVPALTALGYQLCDGALKFNGQNGINGLGNFSWGNAPYCGRSANTNNQYQPSGGSATVDLGTDVEVGSIIVRVEGDSLAKSKDDWGSIANIFSAPNGAVLDGSTVVVRTSGTQVSCTSSPANAVQLTYRTLTNNNGDFLGSVQTSGSAGVTVAGQSRFSAANGTFSASHRGSALKVLSGSDIGSYRIINVAGDGSYVDIRNLDQTTKTWIGSAASVSWEVRDAVREEDAIHLPATGTTAIVTVERLLSPTTLEFRQGTHQSYTNVTWSAKTPMWNLVKRFSYSVMATPPEVANNGTYVTIDGSESGTGGNETGPAKFVADFSDLTTAQRTGRYWKFAFMTRQGYASSSGWKAFRAFEIYDTSGKLVTVCKYNKIDTVDSLSATFLSSLITRLDYIQSANTASSHITGVNGLASIGGSYLDTATLAGGNKWLGFQVRQGTAGSTAGGVAATFTIDGVSAAVDVGRILRIVSGPNAGYYRVSSNVAGTGFTVTTINNAAVTLAADAGPTPWTLHEAITAGSTYLAIDGIESLVLAVSDDLTTLTLTDQGKFGSVSNKTWEIRARGYRYDATTNYPTSSGVYATDPKGAVAFHSQDIDNAGTRSDGATTIGTAGFAGTKFTPDDVGRVLIITGGVDQGAYEIASYVSASSITVKNLYTGGAVSFAASASALTYKIQGERRFRISRYVTVLRS